MALQQVVRRWYEATINLKDKKVGAQEKAKVHKEHHTGVIPQGVAFDRQFKEAHMEHYCIKTNARDNCVSFGNEIALVCNVLLINANIWFVYQSFANVETFFKYPVDSDFLGIFKVSNLANTLKVRPLADVTSKNVILPHDRHAFVVIPIIHSNY